MLFPRRRPRVDPDPAIARLREVFQKPTTISHAAQATSVDQADCQVAYRWRMERALCRSPLSTATTSVWSDGGGSLPLRGCHSCLRMEQLALTARERETALHAHVFMTVSHVIVRIVTDWERVRCELQLRFVCRFSFMRSHDANCRSPVRYYARLIGASV